MSIFRVGVLEKGSPCAVTFQGSTMLCKITEAYSSTEDAPYSKYECATPHGSVVITGSLWVRPLSEAELVALIEYEEDATQKGFTLYGGKL